MRNDNKPKPYHRALGRCEVDFLYCLNDPVSSIQYLISWIEVIREEHGRLIDLLAKFHLSNIPVMVFGRTISLLLCFLSHAAAVAKVHNVISQLHFTFTLIISKYT